MPKISSLSLIFLFACSIAIAQSPQQFTYQAVVRDNNNQLVSNRTIGMRVSILKDSTNGQSAYTETHSPKTNQQGIVQLNIGGGTVVSGSFATVPWSSGRLFVKTEMDLQGGTNYSISGTTQLLSVPYAMYSSNVPVSKSGDTVTIGTSKLIIPGSQLLPGTAPASLSNGLVAYYPFTGNAKDSSGNGRNGQVNGAILTSDRNNKSESAYSVDNSNITVPIGSNDFQGDFSISIWALSAGSTAPYPTILDGANNFLTIQYGTNTSTPQLALFYITEAPSITFGNVSSIADFKIWNHIVVVYENGYSNLYINGFYMNKSVDQSTSRKKVAGNFLVLGNGTQLPQCQFKGKIDEVKIYNRALTQEEITYLANN